MKRRLDDNKHIVDLLFVMAIFLVFTISTLFLILVGTRVYKNTVDKMDKNFGTRTSFAYLTEKIRQRDGAGNIEVGEFDGCRALVLKEDIEGRQYNTYIYIHEGYIKELFTAADNQLTVTAGSEILEADVFDVEDAGRGLLRIKVAPPGDEPYTFYVSTHGGK